jgi:hypothetical protein
MAFWPWKKKPTTASMRMWNLPGDVGTFSLPDAFSVEMENEKTLLAHLASGSICFRFSSISWDTENGEHIAKNHIRNKAAEANHPFYEVGDKGVFSYEQQSENDGEESLVKFWYVGIENSVVVLSASILMTKLTDPEVKQMLDAVPRMIESITMADKMHKVASYGGQQVPITQQNVESFEQKIVDFGPSENDWLENNRQWAKALGVKYGSGGVLTPEELDVVFSRWTHEGQVKEAAEVVASALGVAFGDYLVEQHDFRWVVVNDQYGTDYAVRHRIGETMAFPVSSVIKRIERNEPECFRDLRTGILGVLQSQSKQSK